MRLSDSRLIEILDKGGILDKKQAAKLAQDAAAEKISLYSLILVKELAERDALGKTVANFFHVNYINLDEVKVDPEKLTLLPEIVAEKNNAVVFDHDKNGVHLAVNNPEDQVFIDNFKKRNDGEVVLYFADEDSIRNALRAYPAAGTHTEIETTLQNIGNGVTKAEDMPIIKIVDKLLQLGSANKASDIHIEPFETKTTVRFRIDGLLHDIATIPKHLHELIITRIKILARLRTDEHRAAQDGRLRIKMPDGKVDMRVSIVPVLHGEKVVLRLLSEKARQYDLNRLGFNEKDLAKIENSIQTPWGMILATGPTGCGKTTTLYSILKILNTREVNISTIEDPVEYDIEGINQIQVNPRTNLTFGKGLRAIVRQDPDIIMVGEIRDKETAGIAINSALTGHLVLSTLHTNDAATTLPRLLDMGIKPFLVTSTINIVIAQRLVRKICEHCRYQAKMPAETMLVVKKLLSADTIKKFHLDDPALKLYFGKGCQHCQNTGFQGRVGIYEILTMTDEIKSLIMERVNAVTIKNKALEQGMMPMLEDGLQKVADGVTTIDEILRVTKE